MKTIQPMTLDERCAAYARMAHALDVLGDTWRAHPDLEACAAAVGLSASHFQREFSRWAGVSPKQYQGALAHAAAGEALLDGASVLEAALEAGLSGPGRLHDLFIAHEGLSPGEAKSGGRGVRLTYGVAATPFGQGVFLVAPRGLAGLAFVDPRAGARAGFAHPGYREAEAVSDLLGRYPGAATVRDDAEARRWAVRVFEGSEPVPLALYGTPFRRQVWRALLQIPAGETRSYAEVARAAGRPRAARAAGAAIGANPVSWCIPCHRALASDARLHNYHWGVARKRAMLAVEALTGTAARA